MLNAEGTPVSQRVRAVVARTFALDPSQISEDSGIGNPPAWDSFGHMQLVAAVEEEFGIQFPSYKLSELLDVKTLSVEVQSRLAGK